MIEFYHCIVFALRKSRLGLFLAVMVTWPATAETLVFSPDLEQTGWRIHTPRGKQAAQFVVAEEGVLSVTADAAMSFLYTPVPKTDELARTLSWQWRVDEDFPGTDLSIPGQDDRALAVHVYFSDDNPGVIKRLGRGMASLFGVPVSGRAITYIWGGQEPIGTAMPNPFMGDGEGVLIIKRSPTETEMPQWQMEVVDLASDYHTAFGETAPALRFIAVSADTDDTGAKSRARIKDLRLGGGFISPR